MAPLAAAPGPTLDMQVMEGLEAYISTEQFLHKLEESALEWIDLPDQQQPHAQAHPQEASSSCEPPAARASGHGSSSGGGGFFGLWRRSSAVAPRAATGAPARDQQQQQQPGGELAAVAAAEPAAVAAAEGAFELVEQQHPAHDPPLHEPFVLVSPEDAIEGMAYYIALYLSRAPEARNMDPKQLQEALRQTFTAIRRSRYRVVWEWGRWLYRCGAVSYSALQLYEHPWLVRAVVAAVWTSSKMAVGLLV